MITPARVLVVDEMPDWNTGAVWTEGAEFVSDDAAIVAGLLAGFGAEVELIGSTLGDDDAGRKTIDMLNKMGVRGNFELRQGIETPFEVNVSDVSGGRTYFWNRRPELLATLDDADLYPCTARACSMWTGTMRRTSNVQCATLGSWAFRCSSTSNTAIRTQKRSDLSYHTPRYVRRSLTHPSSVETRSEWRDYSRRAEFPPPLLPWLQQESSGWKTVLSFILRPQLWTSSIPVARERHSPQPLSEAG